MTALTIGAPWRALDCLRPGRVKARELRIGPKHYLWCALIAETSYWLG